MAHGRHEHGGSSSSDVIDIEKALSSSGIEEGDRVVDLGCSSGDYSIAASKLVGSGSVIGIDVHSGSISKFKESVRTLAIKNITIIEQDITKGIPLEDGSVDVALMFNVLHGFVYNGEEVNVLKETSRVLSPGGRLSVIESRPGADGKGPPEEVRLGIDRVRAVLDVYGLALKEHHRISPFHDLYLLVRS